MDSEILNGFIEEAESYIPAIRGGIFCAIARIPRPMN